MCVCGEIEVVDVVSSMSGSGAGCQRKPCGMERGG